MKNTVTVFTIFALLIFVFHPVYAQDFYVYVEELPEWAEYASNVMYLSTKAWEEANDDLQFYKVEEPSDADFSVRWVKEFGGEHVGYAYGSRFIEVGLGDSNCGGQWNPYSERYISHIMKHEIGHIFGHEHNDDPKSIMYPVALNLEYGIVEEEYRLTEGYGQFVLLCTIKDLTSYEVSITTTDQTHGFDYYVIPSSDEFRNWTNGKRFQHYSNEDCFGDGWLSISGTCKGISKGSGIMVIMDKQLTSPLEIITIKQLEKPEVTGSKSPVMEKSIIIEDKQLTPVLDNLRDIILEDKVKDLQKKLATIEDVVKQLEWENNQLKTKLVEERTKKESSNQEHIEIASFVDKTKDPQHYIDRYYNEPKYKEWFDENYPYYDSIYEAVGKRQPIPEWVKNSAKWWSEGKISEEEFVNAIEYLVNEGIIKTK